eukprot:TRINITY_DN97_c0_g3_i1.p1 TRINITY_DN97_c0_g3~~TRINITY_DN97_c0_g3_i1.p1  ORF type:complete len:891 (+),score=-30.34 TRINITY_DN97_c0_g3_i1:376-2673(+)
MDFVIDAGVFGAADAYTAPPVPISSALPRAPRPVRPLNPQNEVVSPPTLNLESVLKGVDLVCPLPSPEPAPSRFSLGNYGTRMKSFWSSKQKTLFRFAKSATTRSEQWTILQSFLLENFGNWERFYGAISTYNRTAFSILKRQLRLREKGTTSKYLKNLQLSSMRQHSSYTASRWRMSAPILYYGLGIPLRSFKRQRRILMLSYRSSSAIRQSCIKFGGVSLAGFPPVDAISKEVKESAITGQKLLDMTDSDHSSLWESPLPPPLVGFSATRTTSVDIPASLRSLHPSAEQVVSMPYQFTPIRTALIKLIVDTFTEQCFVDPLPKEVHLNVFDWGDGASVLRSGLLVFTIGILWDKLLFTTKKQNFEVPWLVAWSPSTEEAISYFEMIKGQQLAKLILEPFTYKDSTFHFRLRLTNGDHSQLWKVAGNKSGGFFRCNLCPADFHNHQLHDLFNFSTYSRLPRKTMCGLLFDPHLHGTKQIPPSILAFAEYLRHEKHWNDSQIREALKDYRIGCDNLHNVKGHLLTILDLETNKFALSVKDAFKLGLYKKFSVTSFHELSAKDLRILALSHHSLLLPYIADDKRREEVRQLFQTWCQIQHIIYLPPHERSRKLILRLTVLCYAYGILCQAAYGKDCMDLYLHTIIAHFPEFYQSIDFYSASSESGESLFGRIKRNLKTCTNRDRGPALITLFTRLHYERIADSRWPPPLPQKATQIMQLSQSFPLTSEISFSAHCHDFQLYIRNLYKEDVDFKIEGENIVFFCNKE